MFEKPYNAILYLAALVLLFLGVLLQTNLSLFLGLALFAAWMIAYVLFASAARTRTPGSLSHTITTCRQEASYFFVFYGVLLAILLAAGASDRASFLRLCEQADTPIWLFAIPFATASVCMLGVPICLESPASDEPSPALIGSFVIVTFLRNTSVFVFAHVILRILYAIAWAGT